MRCIKSRKPIFHITGEKGWINDPNGLVKFKGQYHIFFQYYPYDIKWGPMHWGHVVSDDLLHFKYLPIALTPGDSYDKDGCFSGTALVKDDVLYLVYTGFVWNENYNNIRQVQCLASSEDGIHFKKHGVIIGTDKLPEGYKPCDFRDPKILYDKGTYYLLAVAKKVVGKGSILLYKSKDLFNWEFVNDVLTHDSDGQMLECVDYQKDLDLLLYSEQCFPADNDHCLNAHSCEYEIGKFNKDFKFISHNKTLIDYGFDFYAPQIMEDGKILIAWLNMWDRSFPMAKYGFNGMLTVPRIVTVENGLMLQKPVVYGKLAESKEIKEEYKGHLSIGVIHLTINNLQSLSISLRKGIGEESLFYLDNNEFYFDRSHSGEEIKGIEKDPLSLSGKRKMPYIKKDVDDIYIVLDKYSIELFVNGISMSNLVYPKDDSDIFEIRIRSNQTNLEVFK